MTLAADVRGVLVKSIEQLEGVAAANIHTYVIPPTDMTDDKPVFLITEISNDDAGFGNDSPTRLAQQSQIQIYYPKDYDLSMDDLETTLKQIMRQAGYYCFSGSGREMSPDNQQLMITFKFNHNK
ncbi:DUF806 family protein [Levilactobacillus brevis]|uniref:DUF806 family protein n=1 Tax=Levilactobacillus brevis TaxID=1580 RepID=UPI0021A910D7|nr:DUF806 family protein [Levilactobacillus brevis]MCT3589315.1 DUF806 family protein [Levilactobacillus brevis]